MSEKDIQGIIIPFRPSNKSSMLAAPAESILGEIIDITQVNSPKLPSRKIIFTRGNNDKQFMKTARSITAVEPVQQGGEIPINSVANAAKDTGDIAVEVADIPLPKEIEEVLQSRYQGVIGNEKAGLAWQGEDRMLITSFDSPTNPFTGERLDPPAQITEIPTLPDNSNNLLQFPQPQTQPTENPPSHIGEENIVSLDDARKRSPFFKPQTDPDLKKPAA